MIWLARALCLALFLSAPLASAETASEACLRRFRELISLSGRELKQAQLPAKISINPSREMSRKLFTAAESLWGTEMDIARVRAIAEKIARDGGASLGESDRKFLKELRKIGDVLRYSFRLFDEKHAAPKSLDRYLRKFGKLNDELALGTGRERAQAKELLLALKKLGPELPRYAAAPASKNSIADSLVKKSRDMRKIARLKKVSEESFHDMRKLLKELMNYFRIVEALDPSPTSRETYAYILKLNKDMGKALEQAPARGKMEISPELRERLFTLLDRIQ